MRAISVLSFETGTSTRWCLAAAALRRRVRKSAIGSVCIFLPKLLPTGLYDAGNLSTQRHAAKTDSAHFELADVAARAPADSAAVSHAHLELGLLERLGNFCGSCHELCGSPFTKRYPEALQQLAALLVVLCRRGQRDVHALDLVHSRVIDLREHQLVFQAKRIIPAAVESVRGQAAEVAHARQHHVAQPVEKLVHAVAAQCHRATDGHALANFEVRDGLLRPRDHGLLAGDLTQFLRGSIQQLYVLAGLAKPDIDGNLLKLRHRHAVLPAKALHQRRDGLPSVSFLQSAFHRLPPRPLLIPCPASICSAGNCARAIHPAAPYGQCACACRSLGKRSSRWKHLSRLPFPRSRP